MDKICMEKKVMSQKGEFKLKMLIVVLAFAVITVFGTVVYAASGDTSIQLQDDRGIFDPFALNTIMVSSVSSSDAVVASVVSRPPIRIPIRPVLRSFFRPPLVSVAP